MVKHVKYLVVDTTAFIKAANLQDIAENVYTVQEVVDEITNDRQRRKLVVLPYDLVIKDVYPENVKFITEFSKKTGDYTSLSATDIKVMALTYQLEKENVGTDHLKNEPTMQRILKVTGISNFNPYPEDNGDKPSTQKCTNKEEHIPHNPAILKEELQDSGCTILKEELQGSQGLEENFEIDDDKIAEEIADQIKIMDLTEDKQANDIIVKVSNDEIEIEGYSDSDSDGGEWITASNLTQKKKEMEDGIFEEKRVEVACITSDFAMQNVLKQMGLNVTAADGRIIKQLRTFIFRCTTCFKTTSVMTKIFCPKCGHATLKKVGVSIDEEGNQHIHINGRKPLTARGKRFSLPTPKGGLHFQYPIVTEDQHIHLKFATKKGRKKTDALNPDYNANFSPFAMRDINSRSAVLGVREDKKDVKYLMKPHYKGKKK